jgi:DNA-binding XRE family transcriptional regulator/predicted RNase H-like HicB family nuclease
VRYAAVVTRDEEFFLAEFPDCSGCVTQAGPGERIEDQAHEALESWLGAELIMGEVPPRPPRRAPPGKVIWVEVPAKLATKLYLRWARHEAGLSQAQLAKKVGVTQQAIAKLEHPKSNPMLDTLERVAAALGAQLEIRLTPGRPSHPGAS